ncbi:PPP4R2-domain-containing protein [Pilobolus umbonatus]|nr:PPP4R2-domain-containing protein [Pilobolus umbonatus]
MPEKRKLDNTDEKSPEIDTTSEEIKKEKLVVPVISLVHVEINNTFDLIPRNPILQSIATTNQVVTPWKDLQIILKTLITTQCDAMEDKLVDTQIKLAADTLKSSIVKSIEEHSKCPFTIQRLCELVLEPKKYYKMYIKYLRAVEKVLLVTSYWDDFIESAVKEINNGGPTIICEDRLLPSIGNGIRLEPHHFNMNDIEDITTIRPTTETDSEPEEDKGMSVDGSVDKSNVDGSVDESKSVGVETSSGDKEVTDTAIHDNLIAKDKDLTENPAPADSSNMDTDD